MTLLSVQAEQTAVTTPAVTTPAESTDLVETLQFEVNGLKASLAAAKSMHSLTNASPDRQKVDSLELQIDALRIELVQARSGKVRNLNCLVWLSSRSCLSVYCAGYLCVSVIELSSEVDWG